MDHFDSTLGPLARISEDWFPQEISLVQEEGRSFWVAWAQPLWYLTSSCCHEGVDIIQFA
jgi:hypothetical protein